MLRLLSGRLYTTFRSQRRLINSQGAEKLDNTKKLLSRYPRQQAARGGQNLSDRYLRLEKSLRGREALSKELDGYLQSSSSISAVTQSNSLSSKPIQVFHGFEIPEEPKPPGDDECCMSGCTVCVYDLYEETLEAYRETISSLRNSLSSLHIPEDDWPASIRQQGFSETSGAADGRRKDMVLNAFEEMERVLKLKRQSEAEAQARIKAKRNRLVSTKEELSLGKALAEFYEALRWIFVNR